MSLRHRLRIIQPMLKVILINILGCGLLTYYYATSAPARYDTGAAITMAALLLIMTVAFIILSMFLHGDPYLYTVISLLFSVGLIMHYRIDGAQAVRQAVFFVLGLLCFLVVDMFYRKFDFWDKIPKVYIFLSVALFIATLIFGKSVYGAKNWIIIANVSFQPAELIRILFIIAASCILIKGASLKQEFLVTVITYINLGFLVLQKDWGFAVIFLGVFIAMLYIFGKSRALLIINILTAVFALAVGYIFMQHIKLRVDVWLNPFDDPYGKGYQILQSLYAIAWGGFTGAGLGMGRPSLIPQVKHDFIFSAICEEMGSLGGIAVILLYFILVYRCVKISLSVTNPFNKAVSAGISAMLAIQVFIAVGGVTKFIPMTGITLPFISAGGSSMLTSFIALGIMHAISSDTEDLGKFKDSNNRKNSDRGAVFKHNESEIAMGENTYASRVSCVVRPLVRSLARFSGVGDFDGDHPQTEDRTRARRADRWGPHSAALYNRRTIWVLVAICCLFLSLVVYLTYFTGFESQKREYQAGAAAKRDAVAVSNVRRGRILDRNGVVLAYSGDQGAAGSGVGSGSGGGGSSGGGGGGGSSGGGGGGSSGSGGAGISGNAGSGAGISGNAGSGAGSSGNAGGGGGDGGGGGGNAATGARVYPFKEMYAHVIGYNSPVYGKSRLESSFDDYLSGSGAVSSLLGIRDFIMGDRRRGVDLTLTLDHELQAKAYELLSGRAGAVVAIDPKTGEVLALASLPYFDPNESALAETWTTLQESENAPFLSRATMGLYSPGSTFKAVTAAAAVEKQFDGQMFNDNGSVTIDGRIFNNSQGKVNGRIDVTSAFAVSSNVVFSQLGVEIGEDGLRDIVSRFCIGTSIPFDIELTTSRFNYDVNEGMSAVDLASVGIGQGKLQVTPMQMALVAATIANGGVLLEPYLVKSADISMTGEENSPLSIGLPALNIDPVEIPRNLSLYNKSAATKRAVLSPDTAAKVRDMMIACVGSGTGRSAALSNISVAGKTGTAQNELTDRLRDKEHSWFIAFAPADDPKIAVAVILEYNGVSGGEACGPIARDIISQWLKSET